jgi:DNA-binding transcriptional LysR family regulator
LRTDKSLDLDLAQIQAFVAVAEQRHFGKAAARLYLTPQALSKRILRLESRLSQRLFNRSGSNVECTALGQRLLPFALELLAAADTVAQAIDGPNRSLRIDVWDLVPAPMRALRQVSAALPDLEIEVTLRRSLSDAVTALQRREIDAAFGRVHDIGFPWPDELRHCLVVLQPVDVAMLTHHPLAGATSIHPGDLRDCGLWWPIGGRATEVLGYARRFSEHFDVPVDTSCRGIGAMSPVDQLPEGPVTVVMWATSWPSSCESEVWSPRLEPVPLFPWSLIWRRHDRNPSLRQLLEVIDGVGESEGWRIYDGDGAWLPDVDVAGIR